MLFTSRFQRGQLAGVLLRALITGKKNQKPGVLLETKDSFPIAYLDTEHAAKAVHERHCRIFRADMSFFAFVEPRDGFQGAVVHSGGEKREMLASIHTAGVSTCNINWPDGRLMATVMPNSP